ncbi:phage tail protein [uncultured Mediterranean phage uvMED]|nr:phage tail protein [uncultured Mediterranean phage uvMED]BAR20185.1 phage tail protein [uncultured Mediterranean phage uvMED]BAR20207.1 phage tail protein [uncultured Mediterranean phage uvMED]BAR38356.1 phage tail protein [uncultured Mediterranean phage uvMED]
MGFNPFKVVKKIVAPVLKVLGVNPFVALGISLFLSWILRPKVPEIEDFGTNSFDDFERGLLVNKQSNDANIPVIYGERLTGGTRVFMETSGTDNTYLYMAIVMAEGEINDIEEIRVDDKVVTWASALSDGTAVEVGSGDSNFYKNSESLIRVEPHYGTDGQSASSLLSTLSSWGSNHKLSGLCYLAIRLKWNSDAFAGLPKIQAKIQGKKVVSYNSSLVAQTPAYSTNPAWCLLDYLTNTRYGKGLTTSEINLQSFYDASVVCTTQVTPYSGGSDINIFDTNTALDTSRNILTNVRELIKGCRGYLPYSAGKYSLVIETTGSASITLTEDDIIGGYSLTTPDKNEKYNRVIVGFVDPARNYQVNEVQYPPIDDSGLSSADQHATMKTADGGFLLEGRFSFSTITSQYQAEEMAEVILRRSREALSLGITVSLDAYDLAIGDIVNITHSSLGFSAKPFRVLGITFNEDFTVGLSLVEHQDSHYTWATKTQATATPSTNLPNPFTIQPPASVTLSDTLIEYNDGTVIVALDVSIGASPDSFIDYYQVEYKLNTDSDFIIYAQGSGLNHRVLNVIDQSTYDVRVKAVNSLGVSSTYVSAQRTIVGAIEPPSDVEDFACNIVGQEAHLSWTQIPDLDLAYYNLRFSEETDGTADWQNSVALVEKVSRPATSISVPARAGTYLLKAVDKLGNFSSNATAIISNVTEVTNFNTITTQSEHPTFAGTLTNTVITDDAIELDSSELFDSASGNFDAETTRFFDSGVANADFFASGNYLFSDVIDIGAKHTARITASLTQTSDNPDDLFDNRSGNFDSASSNFDGDTPANANAHIEVATSDDNVTYTAFQNFVIGDYTARYFKFRVVLISRDGASTPRVSAVTVTIDMPDRIFSGNDITSGAGTKTVTFTNPFKTVNYAVGVTMEDANTGDFFTVSNKTVNSFDVLFKNSSGTNISRTFDFIAKGF